MGPGSPTTGLRLRQLKGNLYKVYTPQGSFEVGRDELWRRMDEYAMHTYGIPFDFDRFSQYQVRRIRREAVASLAREFGSDR